MQKYVYSTNPSLLEPSFVELRGDVGRGRVIIRVLTQPMHSLATKLQ